MRKHILLLTLIALLTLPVGCTKPDANPEVIPPESASPTTEETSTPPIEPIKITFTVVENTLDEPHLAYHESYELIAELESPIIRTHINQAIETVINGYKNNMLQTEKMASNSPTEETYKQTVNVQGRMIYADIHTFSYEIRFKNASEQYDDYEYAQYLNFDLSSGQPIELYDVVSKDYIKSQVEAVYPESLETPFNPTVLTYWNIEKDFYFTGPENITFVLLPYVLNFEQSEAISIPLKNLKYKPGTKEKIGTAVRSIELIGSAPSYEIYMSYPLFTNEQLPIFETINKMVFDNIMDFEAFGKQMAEDDYAYFISTTPTVENTEGVNSAENTDSADSTESAESTETTDGVEGETDPITESDEYMNEFRPYWFNTSYTVFTNTEKLLSFGIDFYQYTGGAHGNTSGNFYTFNLESGQQIQISDLFEPKFDYTTYINDQIYRKIDTETAKDPESPYAYYEFSGITDQVKFYIEGRNLVIYFDQYEIAAYAAGTPTFEIPLP